MGLKSKVVSNARHDDGDFILHSSSVTVTSFIFMLKAQVGQKITSERAAGFDQSGRPSSIECIQLWGIKWHGSYNTMVDKLTSLHNRKPNHVNMATGNQETTMHHGQEQDSILIKRLTEHT